jgi:hypothetical protein
MRVIDRQDCLISVSYNEDANRIGFLVMICRDFSLEHLLIHYGHLPKKVFDVSPPTQV